MQSFFSWPSNPWNDEGSIRYYEASSILLYKLNPHHTTFLKPRDFDALHSNSDLSEILLSSSPGDDYAGDVTTTGRIIIDGADATGNIQASSEEDWFRFDVVNDGDIIRFFAEGDNGDTLFNFRLDIYDAKGNMVELTPRSQSDDLGNIETTIAHQFVESGVYYVGITSLSSVGDYRIEATQLYDDAGQDIATAQSVAVGGPRVLGEFEHFIDEDWYGFDVDTVGEIIRFDARSILATGDWQFTGRYELGIYNAAGELVVDTTIVGFDETTYDYGFSETGRYYVGLRSRFETLQTYDLQLTEVGNDDFLPNENTAGRFVVDGPREIGDIQFIEDRDWVALSIAADNQHVQIDFTTTSGAFGVTIFNAQGETVRSYQYESFQGNPYNFDHVFSDAGEYFVEFSFLYGSVGTYSFEALSTPKNLQELTSGIDNFAGTSGIDLIDGLAGDDILSGGEGDDLLFGGSGNDTLNGDAGRDILNGGDGDDVLSGGSGADQLHGGSGEDILTGGDGVDNLFGGSGDDRLEGGAGIVSDIINGSEGTDTAVYSGPEAIYQFTSNQFLVQLNNEYTVIDGNGPIEFFTSFGVDTLIDIEIIDYGGTLLYLTDPDNSVFTDEIDVFFGNATNDIVYAGNGADIIYGQLGDDTIFGEAGADFLYGGDGDDALYGGNGRDVIEGQDGTDVLFGGNDGDLIYGGFGNDIIYGDAGDDLLFGEGGNDIFVDGLGNDRIDGGAGSDTIVYDQADRVVVRLNTQTVDTGDSLFSIENATTGAGNDALIGSSVANILTSGAGDDYLDGQAGDDVLYGGAGNDRLIGGLGADRLFGGAGDDRIVLDANDIRLENGQAIDLGGSGRDTLVMAEGSTFVTGGLSLYGFEEFIGSSGNDRVRGNDGSVDYVLDGGAGNDTLTGNNGNDTLIGGVGADLMLGGAGDDIIYFDANDTRLDNGQAIDLGGSGRDTLIMVDGAAFATNGLSVYGFEVFRGSTGNDFVRGNLATINYDMDGGAGNDRLIGLSGDDTLRGGAGDDYIAGASGNNILDGGDGNDTVSYETAGSRVVVRLNAQTATGSQATGDTISGFENAITGFGNDALIGSDGANVLTAGAGDDYIDALGGDDVLNGGTGNDRLFGRDGNDTLLGGSGNDTLDGGSGNDTVVFDDAGRVVVRLNTQTVSTGDTIANFENATTGAGNDALIGSSVANILTSGAGDDYLDGLGGNDFLIGGTGDDRLVGGSGDDTFVFDTTSGGSDQILDFEQAKDQILFTNAEPAFDTFEEIIAAGVQDGADTVFDFGDGNILRLANTTISGRSTLGNTLTVDDFIFAASATSVSAKPDDLSGEDTFGFNGSYDGFHTIKGSGLLTDEILLNDFDDFGTIDRTDLPLHYESNPGQVFMDEDGIAWLFDPETMEMPEYAELF